MKKPLHLLALILILISQFVQANKEVNLHLAATEWPPYTGSNLIHGGIAAEIVNTIFERMGYYSEFNVYPWQRAQIMVKEGLLSKTR